jgi:hypothetical protein
MGPEDVSDDGVRFSELHDKFDQIGRSASDPPEVLGQRQCGVTAASQELNLLSRLDVMTLAVCSTFSYCAQQLTAILLRKGGINHGHVFSC